MFVLGKVSGTVSFRSQPPISLLATPEAIRLRLSCGLNRRLRDRATPNPSSLQRPPSQEGHTQIQGSHSQRTPENDGGSPLQHQTPQRHRSHLAPRRDFQIIRRRRQPRSPNSTPTPPSRTMVPSHPSTSSLPTPVSLDRQMSRGLQLNFRSLTSAPLFASDSSDADCSDVDSSDADCSDVDSSDVDASDSCSTDSTYMPSASSGDSRPAFFTSSRAGSALPTPQSNPTRSLYVWLLCHDGISEQVGVEKGVAPFLERGSSSNFELRLGRSLPGFLRTWLTGY